METIQNESKVKTTFRIKKEARELAIYNEWNELMTLPGAMSTVIKRLADEEHDWIGSLFCEFTHEQDLQPTVLRQELHDAANRIQYILPEYK